MIYSIKKFGLNIVVIILILMATSCEDKSIVADKIITNAIVWTGNEKEP